MFLFMITFLIELIILLFRFEILSTGDTSIPPLAPVGYTDRSKFQSACRHQSTVRKTMATGPFTCNALRTKTLKERIKTQRKIVSHSNSTRAMLLVEWLPLNHTDLSIWPVGLVWFARYCSKMYSRHLFPSDGFMNRWPRKSGDEVVLFFGEQEKKNSEMAKLPETPLRTGKYFEWVTQKGHLLTSPGCCLT